MSKLWRIALYEYRRNVFKRSFILALLSVPFMIGLNVGVGLFMESRENDNSPVGYVDHAGLFTDPIPAPVSMQARISWGISWSGMEPVSPKRQRTVAIGHLVLRMLRMPAGPVKRASPDRGAGDPRRTNSSWIPVS